MLCLADFVLDSDLCLPDNVSELKFANARGGYSITISNIGNNESRDVVLSAQLVFEADSLREASEISKHRMAEALNYLSYTTNTKFFLGTLKRVVDWSPGLRERRAIIFVEQPEWQTAEPTLSKELFSTAESLIELDSSVELQSAMRWYRLALGESDLEQQYSYFWFALEIASEFLKGNDKVASKCSKCGTPLFCEKCNQHPTHRPFASQAIERIISEIVPQNAEKVSQSLTLIRHTLMHGRRIDSLEGKLPFKSEEAINALARITWTAIQRMFGKGFGEKEHMIFGYTNSVIRRKLVASADISTKMPGDINDPKIADFPAINFQIIERPARTVTP